MSNNPGQGFESVLKDAIEHFVEKELDAHIKELNDSLNRRKREIVASLALEISSRVSITNMGQDIRIHIEEIKAK